MFIAIMVLAALTIGISAIGVVAVLEYRELEDEMVERFDEAG